MDNGQVASSGATLPGEPDTRILHRLDLPTGLTGEGEDDVAGIGVAVAVRTTGRNPSSDTVIELAARRFAYDRDHVITRLDRPFTWRQDPGRPLDAETRRLTDIVDADLAGRSIDVNEATRILRTAGVRIAHGAHFHRPFVDALLPATPGLPWACSLADIDWVSRGHESARLGSILGDCGYFDDARCAAADVDATVQILREVIDPGRTALSVLMDNATAPGWIVRAYQAAFARKDLLRARGYRWSPGERVWWREVRDIDAERSWLMDEIYDGGRLSGSPDFAPADWKWRYA